MTPETVKSVCKAMAILSVAVGGFGSVLCLPYALCSNMMLIATAGVYFIAGAVMITGGLATFAILNKIQ